MNDEIQNNLPDPSMVARAATETAAPRVLEDYSDAIEILRDKKFTFREIAEWLTENFGIPADHNSVWRVYTKHMDNIDASNEAEEDYQTEKEEAIGQARFDGTLVTHTPAQAVASATHEPVPKAEIAKITSKKANKKK